MPFTLTARLAHNTVPHEQRAHRAPEQPGVFTAVEQPPDDREHAVAPTVLAAGVFKSIDDRPILRDLTFDLPPGSFTALLGANGAGKSTLLKLLATLIAPTGGQLEIFGRCVRRHGPHIRAGIGLIGHQSMLYRDLSALENLLFFGGLYGIADPLNRAMHLLHFVGLVDRRHDAVKTFSRGMVQRVAIARALMHEPRLLLADEPFAGLDAPSTRAVERLLGELNDAGRTIILANHDIEQSRRLARRAIVLRRGRMIFDAPTSELSHERILEVIEQ